MAGRVERARYVARVIGARTRKIALAQCEINMRIVRQERRTNDIPTD